MISSNKDRPGCNLDGILYHRVDTDAIPLGWVGAPINVDDNGTEYKTMMVAGSMGLRVSSSGENLDHNQVLVCDPVKTDGSREVQNDTDREITYQPYRITEEEALETGPDTLQPVIGWWMYEVEATKGEGDEYWNSENENSRKLLGLAARLYTTSKTC